MASPRSRVAWRSSDYWARGEVFFNGRVAPPSGSTVPRPASPTPLHKWGRAVLGGRVVRSGGVDSWDGVHVQDDAAVQSNEAGKQPGGDALDYAGTPLAPVVYGLAASGILPLAIRHPRESGSGAEVPIRCFLFLSRTLTVCERERATKAPPIHGSLPDALSAGLPSLHPGRSTLLYCGMVFAVCTASQTLVWSDQLMVAISSSARWDDRLFAVEVLVLLVPQLFAPYAWVCTSTFRKILQDFAKYEALHASIASTPLAPRWVRRRRLLARIIISSCFSGTACVLLGITFLKLRYFYFPAAFYSMMIQFLVTLFFATHHHQLWEAARAICAELHQVGHWNAARLKQTVGKPACRPVSLALLRDAPRVRERRVRNQCAAAAIWRSLQPFSRCQIPVASGPADLQAGEQDKQAGLRAIGAIRDGHRLWVALRTLYNHTEYCFLDVFLLLHLFLSLLLATYMLLVFVASGVLYSAAIEMLMVATALLQLGLITNGAHYGTEQMCGPVVDALDKLSIVTDDPQLFQTVMLFYQSVVAFPAAVSLSGFTSVGRPLFTSVISATVTYMVILIQFQQGVHDTLQTNASHVDPHIQQNSEVAR
ncbi:uncharacterized protein LOC117644391 [Thrips palmi]|uniref:Gustatory receptor n=1 Tax=Thrips palmi TaxID=161013 RepID=A0A6P8ZLZ3_THRPL|nr:uncharacterized protein LOC117644391 [Thrips palmi]